MKNKRKLVIGLLITLAVLISGFTFAYWASGITGDNEVAHNTVSIGVGEAVTTTVTLANSQTAGQLVPAGKAGDSSSATPVDAVVIVYTVTLDEDGDNNSFDGAIATLSVVASDIKVNDVENPYDLVNIALSYTATVAVDGTQTVTVTVTLGEPADATEYAAVAGKDITFDLTFTAADPNVA